MKILFLYSTSWMEMMCHSWQDIPKISIEALPIAYDSPEILQQTAEIIPEYCSLKNIDFVVSVNGNGLIFNEARKSWTPELVNKPWIEWWWDDPRNYSNKRGKDWQELVLSNKLINCIWDKHLAQEYSEWSSTNWHHLPTATHPAFFHPDAAVHSSLDMKKSDVSFLGSYYGDSTPNDTAKKYGSRVLNQPQSLYTAIKKELPTSKSPFEKDAHYLKSQINLFLGQNRRCHWLDKIHKSPLSCNFIGFGFPERFFASSTPVYQPADLVKIFQYSTVNLDLQNGQGISGCNMRPYEIMASQAILCCPFYPEFDTNGDLAGTVYLHYNSVGELQEHVKTMKEEVNKRKEIALNARDYVLENHTWDIRLGKIMQILQNNR